MHFLALDPVPLKGLVALICGRLNDLAHVIYSGTCQHTYPSSFAAAAASVKKEPLEVWILRVFTSSETDDDLILHACGFSCLLLGGHMLPDFSGSLVHVLYLSLLEDFDHISGPQLMTVVQDDPLAPLGAIWNGPVLEVEVLSYPRDKYIRWYRDITGVYIENPANRNTRIVGYQPAGVDRRMMEVDDMASGVIQETPSSPSEIASFAKKVKTIIRRGARRLPGDGARGGRSPTPPDLSRGHADPGRGGEMGEGSGGRGLGKGSSYQVEPFDSPDLGMLSFSLGLALPTQSHPPTSYVPPPPGLEFSSF
ncbi:hypothetical protein M9H77_09195 [Catharanthus roseus]|uniref:Uncharacterized protein n=1 Tax=Catharanthus roseus TaxID=4058 RepID=A0ACC0BZZ0_CATRO|nr:hypothetical protein M9H77_09195 [Catharanthus roseus]